MKDANFDFIKEKFDNCGVHAPAELDADVLTERLPDRPAPVLLPKKSKAKRVAGISAVAAAAVITAGAITFTSMYHQFRPQQPVAATASLRSFQSRDELRQAVSRTIKIRSLNERYIYEERDYEAFADGAVSNEAKQAIPSTHNSTYVQTVGVDEADVVKTTDSHIFYLYGGDSIAIFSAEGKQSKKVAEVTAGDGNISDFFIVGDRLVTLGAADYSYSYDAMTLATVYDISNVGNIRELGTFSQSGSYLSSRMIGDTLYLVSNQYISDENDVPKVSAMGSSTPDSATPDEIPISDIYTVQTPAESTYRRRRAGDRYQGDPRQRGHRLLQPAEPLCDRAGVFARHLPQSCRLRDQQCDRQPACLPGGAGNADHQDQPAGRHPLCRQRHGPGQREQPILAR